MTKKDSGADSAPLTPVDTKRCQAERGGAFMLGPGMVRCSNDASCVVREKEPGVDGQHGAMSLCSDCRSVFGKRMGSNGYEFFSLDEWLTESKEPMKRDDLDKMGSAPIVYGIPWIEVEAGWGRRPSGWRLYVSKEEAIWDTKDRSKKGPFSGGYIGPIRPLTVFQIPFDILDDEMASALLERGDFCTDDFWSPSMKGAEEKI